MRRAAQSNPPSTHAGEERAASLSPFHMETDPTCETVTGVSSLLSRPTGPLPHLHTPLPPNSPSTCQAPDYTVPSARNALLKSSPSISAPPISAPQVGGHEGLSEGAWPSISHLHTYSALGNEPDAAPALRGLYIDSVMSGGLWSP